MGFYGLLGGLIVTLTLTQTETGCEKNWCVFLGTKEMSDHSTDLEVYDASKVGAVSILVMLFISKQRSFPRAVLL